MNKLDSNIKHVFFVVSPITLVISWLIIQSKLLHEKEYIIFFLRGYKSNFFPQSISIYTSKFKRACQKLNFLPNTNQVLKSIGAYKFSIYTPWCYEESAYSPDIKTLLNHHNCIDHSYIEEGQLSYVKDFKHHDSLLNKDQKDWFRDDALCFYALTHKAFPFVDSAKKIVLSNLDLIKKIYSPKLIGKKNIGITCAERRVSSIGYRKMLDMLVNNLGNDSVIKLHPSFENNPSVICSMQQYLEDSYMEKNIKICDREIIVELEMMFEKKLLVGSRSSLEYYAEFFGSSYLSIDLY